MKSLRKASSRKVTTASSKPREGWSRWKEAVAIMFCSAILVGGADPVPQQPVNKPKKTHPNSTVKSIRIGGMTYHPQKDPFEADSRIKAIVRDIKGKTDEDKLENLHRKLQAFSLIESMDKEISLPSPLLKYDPLNLKSSHLYYENGAMRRPPRTAAETLEKGGNCLEFTFVFVSALREMGFKEEALSYRCNDFTMDVAHIIPYGVSKDGKSFAMDPAQFFDYSNHPCCDAVGCGYMLYFSPESIEAEYHRAWGGYFIQSGNYDYAIIALERVLQLNPVEETSYHAHYYLAMLLKVRNQHGDVGTAAKHKEEAEKIRPALVGCAYDMWLASLALNASIVSWKNSTIQESNQYFQESMRHLARALKSKTARKYSSVRSEILKKIRKYKKIMKMIRKAFKRPE